MIGLDCWLWLPLLVCAKLSSQYALEWWCSRLFESALGEEARKSQIVAQPIVRLRVLSSLTVALYTRCTHTLFTLSVTSVL